MAPPGTDEKSAAEYGREALAQFREAARLGAKAPAEREGSEFGELADATLRSSDG